MADGSFVGVVAMVVAMTLPMVATADVSHTIALRASVMVVAWGEADSPPITLNVNTRMAVAAVEEDTLVRKTSFA